LYFKESGAANIGKRSHSGHDFHSRKVESRQAAGLASWIVNIPRELSATGKRQRLFFRTEKEARGECEKLRARKDNFGTSLKALTAHEIHEAVKCRELLEPYPAVSLLQAVQEYVALIGQRTASVPFANAIDEYLNLPRNRSPKYLRDVGALRETFQPLSKKRVVEITPGELDRILARFAPSTRNAHLRILKAIFNLAIRRGWLAENPIARLDFAQFQSGEVEIFTVEEVTRLLQAALETDIGLLPHLALAFFAEIPRSGKRPRRPLGILHRGSTDTLKHRSRRSIGDSSRMASQGCGAQAIFGGYVEGVVRNSLGRGSSSSRVFTQRKPWRTSCFLR
jgi:hypothetical protein